MDDWVAARVVFSEAPYGPYDYQIPNDLEASVKPGVRVEVPLGRGNRKLKGYCIEVLTAGHSDAASVNPQKLKPVGRALDEQPIISERLLGLAKWISEYYLCPLGQVIETIVK